MKTFLSAFITAIGAVLLGLSVWRGFPAACIIIAGIVLAFGWYLAEFGEEVSDE